MRSSSQIFGSLSCALALALIGCGDDTDDTDINAQTGSDASVSESGSGGRTSGSSGSRASGGRSGGGSTAGTGIPPVGAGGQSGGGAGTESTIPGAAGSDAGSRFSDAQILAVVTAANTAEIQLGAIALSNAQLASVRDFAQTLITAHSTAQDRQSTLAQSLTLTPIENSLSTQLEQEAARVGAVLQQIAVQEFDRTYVQSQLDFHTRVLALFDNVLVPSVIELSLRTELTLTRGQIADHLGQATALLANIDQIPIDSDAGVEDAGN